MSKIYLVRVKEDYRWTDAQIDSRLFSKKIVVHIGEAAMTPNILNSDILSVTATDTEHEREDAQDAATVALEPVVKNEAVVNAGPRRKAQPGKLRG